MVCPKPKTQEMPPLVSREQFHPLNPRRVHAARGGARGPPERAHAHRQATGEGGSVLGRAGGGLALGHRAEEHVAARKGALRHVVRARRVAHAAARALDFLRLRTTQELRLGGGMHKPTVLSAAAAERILMWCARNPTAARNVFDCSKGIVDSNYANPADVMYNDATKDLGVHAIVDAEHGLPPSFDADADYSAGFAQGARAIMFLGGYIHLVSHRIGAVTKDVTPLASAGVWQLGL